jgi:hypothetical protein
MRLAPGRRTASRDRRFRRTKPSILVGTARPRKIATRNAGVTGEGLARRGADISESAQRLRMQRPSFGPLRSKNGEWGAEVTPFRLDTSAGGDRIHIEYFVRKP